MQRSAGGPNAARPGTHRPERAQVLEELPVRMTPRRWDKSTGALDRRHGSRNHSHTCQPHVSTRVSQTCGLTTRRCWSVAAAKVRLRAIPGGGRPGGMGGRRGLPIPYGADRLRRCRWCSCLFEALACPPHTASSRPRPRARRLPSAPGSRHHGSRCSLRAALPGDRHPVGSRGPRRHMIVEQPPVALIVRQ